VLEASNAGGLTASLIALAVTTLLAIIAFVALKVRGNRIRALEEDPRIARAVVIVGADSIRTRELMDEALRRLDVLRSRYDEDSDRLTFRTGMSWRSWWQVTQVTVTELPSGDCELHMSSSTSNTQTIGALSAGMALIKKFVEALQHVAPDVPLDGPRTDPLRPQAIP
jgi:hypothetical protein